MVFCLLVLLYWKRVNVQGPLYPPPYIFPAPTYLTTNNPDIGDQTAAKHLSTAHTRSSRSVGTAASARSKPGNRFRDAGPSVDVSNVGIGSGVYPYELLIDPSSFTISVDPNSVSDDKITAAL